MQRVRVRQMAPQSMLDCLLIEDARPTLIAAGLADPRERWESINIDLDRNALAAITST